jgi:hypothetical protein
MHMGGGLLVFGMVDRVPRVCYVATVFFHINLVPLFPLGSYLILEPTRRYQFYGQRISLSWKSVLMGWARTGLLGSTGVASIVTAVYSDQLVNNRNNRPSETDFIIAAVALLVGGTFCLLSILWNRASLSRAVELGKLLGIDTLDMEQMAATARQSLRGLARWYWKSFEAEGSPRPIPESWASDVIRQSQPGRESRST